MADLSQIRIIALWVTLFVGVGACTMEPDYLGYEVNEEEVESTGGTESGSEEDTGNAESGPEGPRRPSIRKHCRRLARKILSDCRQGCEKGDKMCKQRCQREAREFMRRCIKELQDAEEGGPKDDSANDEDGDEEEES